MGKCFSEQYLEEDYEDKVLDIGSIKGAITKNSFLVWDGTDLAKSNTRNMEGLEYVRDENKNKTVIVYNKV